MHEYKKSCIFPKKYIFDRDISYIFTQDFNYDTLKIPQWEILIHFSQ